MSNVPALNDVVNRARAARARTGHWPGSHAEALCNEVERLQKELNGFKPMTQEELREHAWSSLPSKEQLAREAYERWHQGAPPVDSITAKSWCSGYMSAVVDGRRAPETKAPRYLRPSLGTASMFSAEYKLAVSGDWCRGWNALLSALEAAGCEADPNSPWPPLVPCPDCKGAGEVCVGFSGRDDDGNAPLLEPCDTCDRYGKVAASVQKSEPPQSDKCEHGIPRRFCTAVHNSVPPGPVSATTLESASAPDSPGGTDL